MFDMQFFAKYDIFAKNEIKCWILGLFCIKCGRTKPGIPWYNDPFVMTIIYLNYFRQCWHLWVVWDSVAVSSSHRELPATHDRFLYWFLEKVIPKYLVTIFGQFVLLWFTVKVKEKVHMHWGVNETGHAAQARRYSQAGCPGVSWAGSRRWRLHSI